MPPLHSPSSEPFSSARQPLALRSLLQIDPRSLRLETSILPTRTTPIPSHFSRSLSSLFRRQATVTANPIIPATYAGLDSDPAPGTVVGIVFGSVAGFLLILWLIYTCFGLGGQPQAASSVIEEGVVRRRTKAPSRRSSPRRPPSSSESEMIEQSIRRERTRSPTPPPPRRASSRRETIITEETVRREPPPQDEFIEVIVDHSPPPRRKKTKSGFRPVDPEQFGGGDAPRRPIGRR